MADWAKSDPRKDGGLLRRNTLIVRTKRAHPGWGAHEVAEHVCSVGNVDCPIESVGQVWDSYERARAWNPDSPLVKLLEGEAEAAQ
jgi:hypothetical protein